MLPELTINVPSMVVFLIYSIKNILFDCINININICIKLSRSGIRTNQFGGCVALLSALLIFPKF